MVWMTRSEFIKNWYPGETDDRDPKWADSGYLYPPDVTDIKIALPCGCRESDCKGWEMVEAGSVLDHLAWGAPKALRDAYVNALRERGDDVPGYS